MTRPRIAAARFAVVGFAGALVTLPALAANDPPGRWGALAAGGLVA